MTQRRHSLREQCSQYLAQPERSDEDVDSMTTAWPTRLPTSARRYQEPSGLRHANEPRSGHQEGSGEPTGVIPPRRSATQTVRQPQRHLPALLAPDAPTRRRLRLHWLVFVGLALFVMVLGWVCLGAVASWWQVTQDDWHYGRPRTFQIDAVVGHDDSQASPSHFIVLNLHQRIEIIEFPGGDPTKARIYLGPTLIGDGQDLAVVTLSFQDVNGDGKPDMLVHVQGNVVVFLNEGGTFRSLKPGEHVNL